MASTTAPERRHDLTTELGGTLWLAAALFTATVCLAFSLLWLVEGVAEPRLSMGLLAGAAIASIVVASVADGSWSAHRLGTAELGNATRLLGITSILFLLPTALISLSPVEAEGPASLAARDLGAGCPADEVPSAAFTGVAVGSAQERTASCLAWWGVLDAGTADVAPAGEAARGEVAALLDGMARSAGQSLRPAPVGSVPADAADSEHAAAIGRLAAAGIMGGVGDERFEPEQAVTRAQLSTLVARLHTHVTAGELTTDRTDLFADIEGNVHADAIRGAAVAGIAIGDGDTFGPDAPVTRAQLFTILARTLDLWAADHAVDLPG